METLFINYSNYWAWFVGVSSVYCSSFALPVLALSVIILNMLVRVQSRDGTKRITVQPQDTLRILLQQVS